MPKKPAAPILQENQQTDHWPSRYQILHTLLAKKMWSTVSCMIATTTLATFDHIFLDSKVMCSYYVIFDL